MYLYIFLHDDLNFSFYLREKIIEINDIIYLILIYVFLNPKGEICKVRLHFKRFIANIREIIQKSFSAVTLTTNCRMKKTTKKKREATEPKLYDSRTISKNFCGSNIFPEFKTMNCFPFFVCIGSKIIFPCKFKILEFFFRGIKLNFRFYLRKII